MSFQVNDFFETAPGKTKEGKRESQTRLKWALGKSPQSETARKTFKY